MVGPGSGVPEGHGGQQGEDSSPEDFVPQAAGEPLTGGLLLIGRLTGVGVGPRRPAAVVGSADEAEGS